MDTQFPLLSVNFIVEIIKQMFNVIGYSPQGIIL